MKAVVITPVPNYVWYSGLEGKEIDVAFADKEYTNQKHCIVLDTEHNYTVIHRDYQKYIPDKFLIMMNDHVRIICEDNEDAYLNLETLQEEDPCLPPL